MEFLELIASLLVAFFTGVLAWVTWYSTRKNIRELHQQEESRINEKKTLDFEKTQSIAYKEIEHLKEIKNFYQFVDHKIFVLYQILWNQWKNADKKNHLKQNIIIFNTLKIILKKQALDNNRNFLNLLKEINKEVDYLLNKWEANNLEELNADSLNLNLIFEYHLFDRMFFYSWQSLIESTYFHTIKNLNIQEAQNIIKNYSTYR